MKAYKGSKRQKRDDNKREMFMYNQPKPEDKDQTRKVIAGIVDYSNNTIKIGTCRAPKTIFTREGAREIALNRAVKREDAECLSFCNNKEVGQVFVKRAKEILNLETI